MICASKRSISVPPPGEDRARRRPAVTPAPCRANDRRLDLRRAQQPPRHLLVIDAVLEQLLGRVAERRVADVVEQRRERATRRRSGLRGSAVEEVGRLLGQRVVDPAGELHGAEDVAEAAVLGAGKDQVGEPELVDEAQALQRTAVDQRRLEVVGADEAVNRIAESEHRSVVSESRRGRWSLPGARHLSTSSAGCGPRRPLTAGPSLLLVALSMAVASAAAGSDAVKPSIDAGDRAWSRRAEGAEGDRAAPGPIAAAIADYEAALAADPRNLEASWKLARALHFQGEFTAMPAADRERLWERGTELAERSLTVLHGDQGWQDREPSTIAAGIGDRALGAEVHFWAALHWGLWGETKGAMAAVHKGIAKRIRDHALVAIALDETCERGGPRRLLGRLHAVAPRVPFFTGWVSRAEAIAQLERAVAIAPESLASRLYLAEARLELEPAWRDRALLEIEAVIAAAPAPDQLVEDRRTQAEARAALERARAGSL